VLSLVYGEVLPIPRGLVDPVEAAHGFRKGAVVGPPWTLDLFSGCYSIAWREGKQRDERMGRYTCSIERN
jgi:hypothetical protein